MITRLVDFPLRLTIDSFNPHSNIYRALIANPGSGICLDAEHIYARNFEVPSGGAVATARGIAHAYSAFAAAGGELALSAKTLEALSAPAVLPTLGDFDECLKSEGIRFSLGFMKPGPVLPFGSDAAFGSPGAGGAMGLADPESGIGYGYVTSQMGASLSGDPRDVALRKAVHACIRGAA